MSSLSSIRTPGILAALGAALLFGAGKARYGIFLPGGGRLSRLVECVMTHRLPWGGFLEVAVFRPHYDFDGVDGDRLD